MNDKVTILGVHIDNLKKEAVRNKISELIDNPNFNFITTPNPEMIVDARKDKEFKNILNDSSLAVADGFGLVLATKILNLPNLERICGSDLIWEIFNIAAKMKKKIFLLGGLGDVAEVSKKIVQQKFPEILIVGAESGGKLIRKKGEWQMDKGLIERINSSDAEILIIGRGHPWQEKFISDFRGQLKNIRLAIGVGGTFDFISGKIKRSPEFLRKLGLEWIWRLVQEPTRINRIYKAVVAFLTLVIKEKYMGLFRKKKIKVRFAPSPTGFLHIGGLRTALYDWLFARKNGGDFILRIEDTDQARTVEGGEQNILQSLAWAGIEPDEGVYLDNNDNPAQKGKNGPYRQSERLDIYKNHVQELIDNDKAYYCFCTPERLESMRENQIKDKMPPRYDGACRNLTKDDIQNKLDSKIPYVIRLKVPKEGSTEFEDIIFGKISVKNSDIDDQVLIKSDGFPTYHLANVVDDHLMGITHITRGEEWLPSTPKHILLYNAFGWDIPNFAHFPLLLNPDKSKLSKRQGDVAVTDYKEAGYLPQAIINFIALLGWNPKSDQEIYDIGELIEHFDLASINKSGAVFNKEKLDWLNNHYMREMDIQELTKLCIPYFIAAKLITGDEIDSQMPKLTKIIMLLRERANKLSDFPSDARIFFEDLVQYNIELLKWKDSSLDEAKTNLEGIINLLEPMPDDEFISENIEQKIKEWISQNGLKNGPVLWPMRVALSGEEKSPPPFDIAEIIGKENALKRLNHAVNLI